MIRVMLVDDHASFRQPLAFMLGREADITVVAEAGSLAEARTVLARAEPVDVDVAIVDLHLPDGDGVDVVRDLRAANPDGQVLVLSGETERDHLARAIEAGASGMLHKSARIAEIIDAVRRLCDGESLLSPRETVELFRLVGQQRDRDRRGRAALDRLTPREREVLAALADGLNDKEIAQRLGVGNETVRTHMVNVFGKLGVDSRLQALLFALRHGAITLN